MQQVTIEWLYLNGKNHMNTIAIPVGHINLSRIDDWFRAGNLNVRAYSVLKEMRGQKNETLLQTDH